MVTTYRNVLLQTATNEQLLVLLLERAMSDETQAIAAMERGARTEWIAPLIHGRSIYLELLGALDHAFAPELSANLRRTYTWAMHELATASRTGDADAVRGVRQVTETLYEGWVEALGMHATEIAAAS